MEIEEKVRECYDISDNKPKKEKTKKTKEDLKKDKENV